MNISAIDSILENSAHTDWLRNKEASHFTYRTDLCLRIEKTKTAIPVNNPWVKELPNSYAYGVVYTVFYNLSFISEYDYICIDKRVDLPANYHLNISNKDYNITKIINNGETLLRSYLRFFNS